MSEQQKTNPTKQVSQIKKDTSQILTMLEEPQGNGEDPMQKVLENIAKMLSEILQKQGQLEQLIREK